MKSLLSLTKIVTKLTCYRDTHLALDHFDSYSMLSQMPSSQSAESKILQALKHLV